MSDTTAPVAVLQVRTIPEIAEDAARSRCPECSTKPLVRCDDGVMHAMRFYQAFLDGNITDAEFRAAIGGAGLYLRLIPIT